MQLKKGQIVDVDIDRFAFQGGGIGKFEGLNVFVPDTMPGDKVSASFRRIKKSYAEAKLEKIICPSKDRKKPECKFAGVCGGCNMQHIPYETQLILKKQFVVDSFERIGGLASPPVEDVIGCDANFYYRNKMEFSFGFDEGMNFALGMHLPGRRYDILDLPECMLMSEFSVQVLNKIREFCLEKKWMPRMFKTGEGFLRSLYIREGKRTGEVMVILMTAGDVPEGFETELKEFVEMLKAQKISSIYWAKKIAKRGFPTRISEIHLYGKKYLNEKMIIAKDEMNFEIMPLSFFQVNTFQAEVLYGKVLEFTQMADNKLVFDLYCGTGTIGLFLAKHVEQVMGIELNPESVKAAQNNALKNGIFNIDFYTGDVGKMLKTFRLMPSLIVVDPPRAGLTTQIIKQLNDLSPAQIIYVSCNPPTLARDSKFLAEFGFKIKTIQPIDMFPHTYHVENVCLIER